MIHEIIVDELNTGKRLDTYLSELDFGLTRSQIKNLIDQSHIEVDGKLPSKAGLCVYAGQKIRVTIPDPVKLDLTAHDVGIKIIYEDDHLAVLEKPPGISVHPSQTENAPTVVHGLLHSLKTLSSVGGVERPRIVHRIDKGTSGILVVSKTDAAHLDLSRQFKAHTINRRYRALVYGDMRKAKSLLPGNKGRIETFYGRSPSNRKKMTGRLTEGRKAITHWFITQSLKANLTLVECQLETGRTHQIRVHLSELGFPIVGDPLYGSHEKSARSIPNENGIFSELKHFLLTLKHQLLHAYLLEFEHPITKTKLHFESELPEEFKKALDYVKN